MKVIVKDTSKEVDLLAARLVVQQILLTPEGTIGFANGNTTIGLHGELLRLFREGLISFEGIKSFNLDEYAGLDMRNPESCQFRMYEQLFNHVNIKKENIHFPTSMGEVSEAELKAFEEKIAECGGIDLQVLGIGENGHIAFNDPGTAFNSISHVSDISEKSRRDKIPTFASLERVPTNGVTMGLKTIMHARKLLLITKGSHKADIIRATLNGPVNEGVPASIIQLHPDCTVILDKEAAAAL